MISRILAHSKGLKFARPSSPISLRSGMKRLILMLPLLSMICSCNGKHLSGSVAKDRLAESGGAESSSDQSSSDQNSDKPLLPKQEAVVNPPLVGEIEPPVAVTPVVIGGAHLTCSPVTEGAECSIRDSSYVLVEPLGLELYIIAPDLIWKAADYQRLGLGKYLVKTKLDVFAVGIRDSRLAVTATWVKRPEQNLVKNGSFEDFGNTTSGFFEAIPASGWSALPVLGGSCARNYLDIQVARTGAAAADGTRYMDLKAVCDPTSDMKSTNHKVSQTLPTIKGQLYQVFYSISGNPNANDKHSYHLDWNGNIISRATFEAGSIFHWIELKFLLVAESNSDKFSFQDKEVNLGGAGGLIDNIQVFRLGTGPVP